MLKQNEIEMLENRLLDRKKQLSESISSSRTLIKELMNESSCDDTDYAEISSDSHNMNAITNNQLKEITEIEIVLNKIKNKTYGICDMCDEEIGIERLNAKPHAIYCVNCRPIYEKSLTDKNSN